jgi:hypothetical protein
MTDAQVPENAGERVSECVSETHLNIYQRINYAGRILRENPWIKDMTNSAYKSVDIDQIRHYVGDAETEAGIVVEYIEEEFGTMEHGGKVLAKIRAKLIYTNIDEPDDIIVFSKTAVAFDAGDKGWNKAESMLYKNHYKGLYHIGEREDDPDSMSNEENDIIEAVRGDKNVHDAIMVIVNKHLPGIREAAKKAEEQAKIERRREMSKGAENFLKRPEPKAEPKPEPTSATQTVPTEVPEGAITADDAVTLDRPIEQIRQSLGFFMGDLSLSEIINPARQAWGSITKWTDDQCRQIYLRCVKAKRTEEVTE